MNIVTNVYASGSDDPNVKEVGIWRVKNYYEARNAGLNLRDLTTPQTEAEGFYGTLVNQGFTGVYNRGDGNAWERHFEKSGVSGWDSSYVDACDFVYFAGHGDSDQFYFGTNHDGDGQQTFRLHYSEADWGDADLEWSFISACYVLNNEHYTNWFGAFHNPKCLHGITGFDTSFDDLDCANQGRWFAECLTGPNTNLQKIKEAWMWSTKTSHPAWVYAAIMAVYVQCATQQVYYWDECLPGYGLGMNPDPPTPSPGMTIAILYTRWMC